MKQGITILAALAVLAWCAPAGASERGNNLARLKLFALALGRSAACGCTNGSRHSKQVGRWVDRVFPVSDRKNCQVILAGAMFQSFQDQKEGRTPDTCAHVCRRMREIRWP